MKIEKKAMSTMGYAYAESHILMRRAGFSEEMAAAVAFLVRMKPPISPDKRCL